MVSISLSKSITYFGEGLPILCHSSRRLWTADPDPMITTPSSLSEKHIGREVSFWNEQSEEIYLRGARAWPSLMWASISSCSKVDTSTIGISGFDFMARFKGTQTPWSLP
jgi:hypothetical protein